jgi:hypothetical protein
MRPLIEIVDRSSCVWQWPAAFMATGALRLAELGYVDKAEAERMARVLDELPAGTRMVTPLVVEVIARKRRG